MKCHIFAQVEIHRRRVDLAKIRGQKRLERLGLSVPEYQPVIDMLGQDDRLARSVKIGIDRRDFLLAGSDQSVVVRSGNSRRGGGQRNGRNQRGGSAMGLLKRGILPSFLFVSVDVVSNTDVGFLCAML